MRLGAAAACALLLLGACDDAPAPVASAASSSAPVASAPPARAPASAPPREPKPAGSLARLAFDADGRFVAELARPGKPRALAVLATREAPLAPREPAAYRGIAELLAPGLAPATELSAVPLRELMRAATDARTRRAVERRARVLADGTVLVAFVTAPAARLRPVDLTDVGEGRRAWTWESKLVKKDAPPEELGRVLASYQALLSVDYLVENLARGEVLLDEGEQRLVAVEHNQVFSPRPIGGRLGDPLARLAGHLVYSRTLADKLAALEQSAVERALSAGPDDSLLVTPKQVDEVLERKRTLQKLMETRVRQRGRERALALP